MLIELLDELRQIVADTCRVDISTVTADTPLDDLENEVDIFEFMSNLEKHFGIIIQDRWMTTVGELADYIQRQLTLKKMYKNLKPLKPWWRFRLAWPWVAARGADASGMTKQPKPQRPASLYSSIFWLAFWVLYLVAHIIYDAHWIYTDHMPHH